MKRKPSYLAPRRKRQDRDLRFAALEIARMDAKNGKRTTFVLSDVESSAKRFDLPLTKLMRLCKDRIEPEVEKEPEFAIVPIPEPESRFRTFLREIVRWCKFD